MEGSFEEDIGGLKRRHTYDVVAKEEYPLKIWNMKKWEAAQSWIALVQLNIEYLLQRQADEYAKTPYDCEQYEQACHEELIPGLLRLHEYRLLTVQSRPVDSEEPYYLEEEELWEEWKDLPFVKFFMPYEGKTTEALISNLINDSQLKTYVFDNRNDKLWPGSSNTVEVMMSRMSTSLDALPSERWKAKYEDIDEVPLKEFNLKTVEAAKDTLFCAVVASENINLLERVEHHAIQAGLERTSFDSS